MYSYILHRLLTGWVIL